jgi:Immunity protein 53
MNTLDNLEWLEDWYRQQCDGAWENLDGLRLEPTVRPGWHLTINLKGTSSAAIEPRDLQMQATADDWTLCRIAGDKFEGFGDPQKLEQIIGVFRHWVCTSPEREVVTPA